ncbi:GNAT family N-acetyltransferase [Brotaphodocola sp.]|uniref:GNAT family N-acetyltransferase n=1 Tax=Brotaphodocola sp. TaxID=3073577 RepID=UPI003D7C8712
MSLIRKARESDLAEIEKIYEKILSQEEAGKTAIGWVRGVYPTLKTAWEAWNAGELFVMEAGDEKGGQATGKLTGGILVAAARINQIQVLEYADAAWEYEALDDQVMVLHTLVVDPDCAGKGYGSEFVAFYEKYAGEHGCPYLRMDTNAKNQTARRLYHRLGYREVGIVPCVFNGISGVQLVCLEKRLNF